MLQLCAKISYGFASAQRYLIRKSAFLIQAPPAKPAAAFQRYYLESIKGRKGIKVTEEIKKVAEEWKKLSQEARSRYQNDYKAELEDYIKRRDIYNQKYVSPFQLTHSQALAVSHFYATKQITISKDTPIQQYGKKVSELTKKLTPQQQSQFKKQAEKINAEKRTLQKQFMFPQRLYNTQTAFSRNHSKLYTEQRKNAYKTYIANWEADVEAWLIKNKIQMQLSDFKRLYNRELKNKKTKTEKQTEKSAEKTTEKTEAISNK